MSGVRRTFFDLPKPHLQKPPNNIGGLKLNASEQPQPRGLEKLGWGSGLTQKISRVGSNLLRCVTRGAIRKHKEPPWLFENPPRPDGEKMEYVKLSWDDIEKLTKKLAEKIKKSRFKFDWIVGISRGGLVPARIISDYFDCPRLAVMRVEFYKSVGKTRDFPRITQPLQVRIKGKNVLVVDDVADTGRSLIVADDHIKRKGAKEIKIATLHYKPVSIFKPDFYVEKTNAWIIYPWEKKETERMLKKEGG